MKRRRAVVPGMIVLAAAAVACSTAVTRESFIPVPEHPPAPDWRPDRRGLPSAAEVLPTRDQAAIMAEVLDRFYRPMMQHARWIDPRRLAHVRTRAADTAIAPTPDWALAIADAARIDRVCPLGFNHARCAGLAGGVLRFSPAYAVGTRNSRGADTALAYVHYAPRGFGVETEMEFLVTRTADGWRVVSRRALPPIADDRVSLDELAPREALDSLLAADRRLSASAADTTFASALARAFVENVFLQAPGGFVRSQDSAEQSLAATPLGASRASWTPVKGGISSDYRQGFTGGYMTATLPDSSVARRKYLAYWIRGEGGWRIAAYKVVAAPTALPPSLAALPATLPVRGLPRGDETTVQRHADSLSLAEHAFSATAQEIGLGPAFAQWGAPDAINLGGPTRAEMVVGPDAIAAAVSDGLVAGTRITWAPERVIVARTGDLGVSIGTIRITPAPTAGQEPATREVPFFTVWMRAAPGAPWRYVAE